jgi:3-hydroxyacyl-[acyl-carrier-protein] dehydratase
MERGPKVMLMNNDEVKSFLPHRDPFLFIDSVNEITLPPGVNESEEGLTLKELVGAEIVASFYTREDLSLFRGHFPGNPILPGVIQIEMMAQASCFMSTKVYKNPESVRLDVALMGVSQSKFRRPVKPNMDLTIKAKLAKARGPVISYECEITHEGILMSEASVLATVNFVKRN